MRTIILGGTGILGAATRRRLLAEGHEVSVVARDPGRPTDGAVAVAADLDALDGAGLVEVLRGHDSLVYALGPDDRARARIPEGPYFQAMLADRTERAIAAARAAGIGAAVVLGSYFSTWSRAHPGLAARHVYIQARNDQARRAFAAGADAVRVSVLEVPWVFGAEPSAVPHWKRLLYDPLRFLAAVPVPGGGTTTVALDTVTEAVVAALHRGRHGAQYPVGDADLPLRRLFELIAAELGSGTRILPLPAPLGRAAMGVGGVALRLIRHGVGLDPAHLLPDILERRVYVDHAATRAELGLERRDVVAAIRASVRTTYPHRFPTG